MSSFYEYIEKLVSGEHIDDFNDGFPKNESSWEELFDFGEKRINEIVELKREIIRLQSLLKNYEEPDKELTSWYSYKPCRSGHSFMWSGSSTYPDSEPPEGLPCACGQTFYHRHNKSQTLHYAIDGSYFRCIVFIP